MKTWKHVNDRLHPLIIAWVVDMINSVMGQAIGGGLRAKLFKAEPQTGAIHSAAHAARPWARWA